MERKRCSFKIWHKKKKEYINCKFPICKNESNLELCEIHLPLNEIGPHGKMVLCPQCKDKMGEETLKKHLEKCKKSLKRKADEISDENIITPRIWLKNNIKINDIPEEIISKIEKVVNENYDKLNINISKRLLYDEDIINEDFHNIFPKEQLTGKNSKNILQEISIYENAKKLNIVSSSGNNNIVIELGCGAAELSRTFQMGCKNNSSHILIDRMKYASKNKFDKEILEKLNVYNKQNNLNNFLIRDTIDIKNMDVKTYIDEEKEKNINNNIIFISKHLCGNAFELSIEKIISYHNYINEKKIESNNKIGIIIATCCHYLLNSNTYCNPEYIKNILNINNEELDYMIRLTSWGTLKDTHSDRFKLGKKIKYLLDKGRCEYLKSNGFKKVEIVEFIDSNYTKENTLIIAY